jgi:hypothetical protein
MIRKLGTLVVLTLTLAAPLLLAGCQTTAAGPSISDEDRARYTTSKNVYRPDLAAQHRNLR